jgi:hypothetical protein
MTHEIARQDTPAVFSDHYTPAHMPVPMAVVTLDKLPRTETGTVRLYTPDGREIVIDPRMMAAEMAPAMAPAAPTGIPRWALTTAVLMPASAGSLAVAAWGLSLAAGAFTAIAAALWSLFLVLLGLAVLIGVVMTVRPKKTSAGPVVATATATARGLFGRATSTATARKG